MDIYRHFTDIPQGWSIGYENDICVYQRMGRGFMGKKNALHLDGIRGGECAGFSWGRVTILHSSQGYILDLNLGLCAYKINSTQGKISTHLNGISWTNSFSDFQRMKTMKMQAMN